MPNPVVHFEIGVRDTAKAIAFYGGLFDWEIHDQGPAKMVMAGPKGIGGHFSSLGHEPHNFTHFYVQVDDVQAYLDKAATLGGKMIVPPVTIPDGVFAWMSDPEGNIVGLWKPNVG